MVLHIAFAIIAKFFDLLHAFLYGRRRAFQMRN
jgi:hypothetical protein